MTSTLEAVGFWILAPIALGAAIMMLFSRNAVHAALWLVVTMLCLGVLYLIQDAPFLGLAQIVVYTGAIMMLFLFVLMLAGRDSADSIVEVLRGQRLWAGLLGLGLIGLLVTAVLHTFRDVRAAGLDNPAANGGPGNVANIGRAVFTTYLFPFELTSALIITAAVGAMVLAFTRKHTRAGRIGQRELVNLRLRGEHDRPSPLPGPGVFATTDSVATPALLPDGSIARESLSHIIATTTIDEIAEREKPPPEPDPHALTGEASTGQQRVTPPAPRVPVPDEQPDATGDEPARDDQQEGTQV